MLRAVRLKNFVNFREDQLLHFDQDGVYFFVGQTGSGKSRIFEAIRQCLTPTFDTSFAQKSDEDQPTYIICKYVIPPTDKSCFNDFETIFTSFVHIPKAKSKCKHAKIVVLVNNSQENVDVYIEFIETQNGSHYEKKDLSISHTNTAKTIADCHRKCTGDRTEERTQAISQLLDKIEHLLEHSESEDNDVSSNRSVLTELENRLVFTFGMRSLGPLQWSKSTLMQENNREENYKKARMKCEIINYFLSEGNKFDNEEEQKIFGMLTDGAKYLFRTESNQVYGGVDNTSVEVLKMPEGIMEAKYLSLLLTSTEFCTIFLEEPDRGMHPQMIEKIRDFVLPKVTKKTIIIATHNPRFMSSWSIPRTYKFYRTKEENKLRWNMINIGVNMKDKNKIPRLLASDDYASVIFANTVMFLEGQSDFLFLKALIAHIMNTKNDDTVKNVLKRLVFPKDVDDNCIDAGLQRFRTWLASLHVVNMNGVKNQQKWHKLSEDLRFLRLFLLDMDAVVQVKLIDAYIYTEDIVKRKIETRVSNMLNQRQPQNTPQLQQHEMQNKITKITNALMHRIGDEIRPPDHVPLNDDDVKTRFLNVIDNLFSSQHHSDDLKTLLRKVSDLQEVDVYSLSQYYNLKYEDVSNKYAVNSNEPFPKVKIVQPLKRQQETWIVSEDVKSTFDNSVQNNNWEEAAQSLEKGNVFVWRTGTIENAFEDVLRNDKPSMVRRRRGIFKKVGIDVLDSSPKARKLYMDGKVSDDDIQNSIHEALTLIDEKSDITRFLRFLVDKIVISQSN